MLPPQMVSMGSHLCSHLRKGAPPPQRRRALICGLTLGGHIDHSQVSHLPFVGVGVGVGEAEAEGGGVGVGVGGGVGEGEGEGEG